jgi:hypothetical protein
LMGGMGAGVPPTGRGNTGTSVPPRLLTFVLDGSLSLPAASQR